MAPAQSSNKGTLTSVAPKSSQLAEIHSRPHHFKKFIGRAAFGAALLISCLQAGAASALSFNFSFSGPGGPQSPATVTGIVDGLVDNLAGQTSGLTFTIISATNTPAAGWGTFTNFVGGSGIDVSGGQVTGSDVWFKNIFDGGQDLYLGNIGNLAPELSNSAFSVYTYDTSPGSTNTLLFTAASPAPASVPGPLPLFGAGAAFGWSRRLRRRIKSPV